MLKNLSSNKVVLLALGLIAIIGLTIISFNGSQTSKTQISPTPQPSSRNFTKAKMSPIAQSKPVTGQIIVKFKAQYTTAQINAHLKQYNASILKQITGISQTVVKVPAGQEEAISQQLKTDPYVDTVQRDYTTHAFFTPNDPNFSFQYGLNNTGQTIQGQKGIAGDDIHAEAAWDVTRGNGIKVAILDTGINLNQPDLAGKVIAEKVFLSQPSPGTDTGSVEDQNGHGTHVAGILAANTNNSVGVAGVCPGCQLIIGRILDNNGDGTTSDSVAGITWAADQGAKVINMSLGTPDASMQSLYAQAVSYAESKGAVVVAAAGNCGGSDYLQEGCTVQNETTYPAGIPGAISVGATDNRDQKAVFSNYGSSVEIAAPGDNILSTGPTHSFDPNLEPFGYNTSVPYFYLSGTSMATPYVSGVAALVASTAFGTTPQTITNRLYATADKIAGTGTYWAHGRVDAAAAVGPAPSAPQPSSALITPTVYCVGGKGVSPCQPLPSGTTIVSPATGGGQNSSGVSGAPISGGETNPSISPSSEENGNVSSSPSPVVSGTPGGSNGKNQICQNVNVDQAFYNLASQQPATGIKVHIKCGSGGGHDGNNGGGNNNPNNGWLSKFFQFLLELLQLLLQLITQCLPSSNSGTPLPSVSPAPSVVVPSISTSLVPSINTVSPASGGNAPSSAPSTAPQPSTPVISLPTACTKTISPGTSITTTAAGMAPGGVLCVNGGNYSESVTISKSGASEQFITLRNATAAMPVITKLTFSANVSFITVNGFEITGGDDPLVMITQGAHDINITNNKIHHGTGNGMLNYGNNILVQGNDFTDFANEDAIRFWGDHQTYLNNHIHDIQNPGHNDAFQTWRQTSDLRPPVTNLVVKNNVIQNIIGSNAHCFAVENQTQQVDTNWTISNNTFTNIGAHCLILGDPSHPESGVQNLVISNNKFTTIGGDAIECNGPTTGTLSGNTFSGVGGTQIVNDSGGKCTGQ